jgi:hypothetical protein
MQNLVVKSQHLIVPMLSLKNTKLMKAKTAKDASVSIIWHGDLHG